MKSVELERFQFLMGIIDKYVTDTPIQNSGPLKFLKEDIFIRNITIASNHRVNEIQLKTFLLLEVLQMHENISSKISCTTIQNQLEGKTDKKYLYNFSLLEECFNVEKNKKALKEWYNSSGLFKEMVAEQHLFDWKQEIPYLLLTKIQNTVEQKIKQYWQCCKSVSAKKEEEKNELYVECLLAIALHEIFVKEFLESETTSIQECNKELDKLSDIVNKMRESTNGIEKISFTENDADLTLKNIQGLREKITSFEQKPVFMALYMKFIISVIAEEQIILLLEGLSIGKANVKEKLIENCKKYTLEYLSLHIEAKDNRNKWKYYNQISQYIQMMIFPYMQEDKYEDIFSFVYGYLEQLEQGATSSQQFWRIQCMLAQPRLELERNMLCFIQQK